MKKAGSIFGISKMLTRNGKRYPIFDGAIETVFGPAAGPNTQLAQNLVAAYRRNNFIVELKTVQRWMDGSWQPVCPSPASRRRMSAITVNGQRSWRSDRLMRNMSRRGS